MFKEHRILSKKDKNKASVGLISQESPGALSTRSPSHGKVSLE